MKIEFTLTEKDLLTHQLFATSKAKRVVKRRAQGKIFLMLIYMATGIFIWERNGVVTGAVFFLVCLPLYFLYASMERKQYVKHISAFVNDQFKTRGDKKTSLDFGEQEITMKDGDNESVVPMTELEIIHEIDALYSISLKSGQAILIPKQQLTAVEDTSAMLLALAERLDIPYHRELGW
ncbi:MAG TPA: hypothetical protein PLV75_10805, partial [Saprospiraceae bacterium]|nr:hypothetical protein [Saprospiraceae bacterium]